jgi:flagellar basal body-associated protein FliL
MAANLKKEEKKAERAAKGEGPRFSLDLKWLFAALGLALIVFSSVIIGVKVSVDHFTKQTITKEVEKPPALPGPIVQIVADGIVNLKGGRYCRFACSLQFNADKELFPDGGGGGEGKKANPLERYEALLKDSIMTTISKHEATWLLDPENKEKLKLQIQVTLNNQLKEMHEMAGEEGKKKPFPQIFKVYFTSFVIS